MEAMLAAVEVYNKPAFAYREESFSVLAVNAWELLLKARILEVDGNRLAAILEYETRTKVDGNPSQLLQRKKNRSGNCVTIGLFKAYDRLVNDYSDTLDPAIRPNLEALVEIRDNAVHFFNKDLALVTSIHEIGAASLKNYMSLTRRWFGVDLTHHGMFLMPLAFVAAPASVEGMPINGEERHLLAYLATLRESHEHDASDDFSVALTIEIRVKRSKDDKAVPFTMSKIPDALPIKVDEESIRETYPWDHEMLVARLKKRYSAFKVNNKYYSHRSAILAATPKLSHDRLLDPAKPAGLKKTFYDPNIVKEFDPHYERAVLSDQGAAKPGAG